MKKYLELLAIFDKHQRNAIFTVLACTSLMCIILFLVWEDYWNFDWYVQGVFALGASVAWVATISAWAILCFQKENPYFYFSIILLALLTWITLAICYSQTHCVLFLFGLILFGGFFYEYHNSNKKREEKEDEKQLQPMDHISESELREDKLSDIEAIDLQSNPNDKED